MENHAETNIPSNNVGSPEKHSIQPYLTSIPHEINEITPDSLSSREIGDSSLEEEDLIWILCDLFIQLIYKKSKQHN